MSGILVILVGLLQAAASDGSDRPRVSLSDFEGLAKNNVFAPEAPPRPVRKKTQNVEKRTVAAKPSSKPPVVTGFIFDAASKAYQVIVEDRNTSLARKLFSGPMFLKPGEEFLEYRIEKVTASRVTVVLGEVTLVIGLGSSFPAKAGATSAGGSGEENDSVEKAAPALTIEDPGIQRTLERLRKKNAGKLDD